MPASGGKAIRQRRTSAADDILMVDQGSLPPLTLLYPSLMIASVKPFLHIFQGAPMRRKSKDLTTELLTSHESIVAGDKTIIGEGITIEGTIRGREDLIIHGTVRGNIEVGANHLTVGAKGLVEAEIEAESVTISGRIKGNVRASQKVAITREADFNGEVRARSISVEDGAFLKAMIELQREPEEKASSGPGLDPMGQAGKDPGRK